MMHEQVTHAIQEGDFDRAERHLLDLISLSGHTDRNGIEVLERVLRRKNDVESIGEIWQRSAFAHFENDDYEAFLHAASRSASRSHNYTIDLSLRTILHRFATMIGVVSCSVAQSSDPTDNPKNRSSSTKPKLCVALSESTWINIDFLNNIALHHDSDLLQLSFISPFALSEEPANQDAIESFYQTLSTRAIELTIPQSPLNYCNKIEFLKNQFLRIQPTMILYPGISCPVWVVHQARQKGVIQVSIAENRQEHSRHMHLVITHSDYLATTPAPCLDYATLDQLGSEKDPCSATDQFLRTILQCFDLVTEAPAQDTLDVEESTSDSRNQAPVSEHQASSEVTTQALNEDDLDPESIIPQALSYLQQDRPEQALSLINQAISLRPEFHGLHYFKAQALFKLGHLPEALEVLQFLLVLEPGHKKAQSFKEELESILGLKAPDSADLPAPDLPVGEESTLEETCLSSPQDAAELIDLAIRSLQRKDVLSALQHLTSARELHPTAKDLHYVSSLCYVAMEDFQQAHFAIEKELEIDPENAGAHALRRNIERVLSNRGELPSTEKSQ